MQDTIPGSLPPVTPLLRKQQGSGNFRLWPRRSLLAIADEVNAAPGSVLRGLLASPSAPPFFPPPLLLLLYLCMLALLVCAASLSSRKS